MSTTLHIPTPGVGVPWTEEMFAALPSGSFPSVDNSRILHVDSRAAAYAVMEYATLAMKRKNELFEQYDTLRNWSDDPGAYGFSQPPDPEIVELVWFDYITAERQIATLLPIMADMFTKHGMHTDDRTQWMRDLGIGWGYVDETVWTPDDRVVRYTVEFARPADWTAYADEKMQMVLDALDELNEGMPPTMQAPIPPVGVIVLIVLAIGLVGYAVAKVVSEILAYMNVEAQVIEDRKRCVDEAMQAYVATGNERELERAKMCHDEMTAALWAKGIKDAAMWIALGAVGIFAVKSYSERQP